MFSARQPVIEDLHKTSINYASRLTLLRSTMTPEHAFMLEEDSEAYLDIKDDMTEEAEKHGEFTTITLFDM
jgi:hypothetical protein